MGNDAGALAGTFGEYDQDDREADEVIAHFITGQSLSCIENHKRLHLLGMLQQQQLHIYRGAASP